MRTAPAAGSSSEEQAVPRQGTLLERAGTQLQRAGSNLGLQRASTLPTDSKQLRHAATMPITHDMESARPFCGGMWKLQQMIGFILGVLSLVLLALIRPIKDYPSANDMLGITLMCGFFWVLEVSPIYITALAPLALMPLLKVTSSEIAANAYWNEIQMLVIGTYLVDLALEEVHLPRRAVLKMLIVTGVVQPGVLLFSFMFLCWLLSMFCNNIAVTLMITPFAIEIMNAAEEQARDDAAAASDLSDAPSSSDDEAPVDASTAEVQKFSSGLLLGIAYASTCGGLATLTGTITNEVLFGVGKMTSVIAYANWWSFAFPTSAAAFILSYSVLWLRYCRGLKLKALTHEVLEQSYDELVKEIGPFSRDELFVGILQVIQFVLLFLRPTIAKHVTSPYGESLLGDPTLAMLPAVLLFFIPSSVRPGQPLLTWPSVHEKFDFGLLFLIGGGFAISTGFIESGLNTALGKSIASWTEVVSPFWLNFIIVLLISVATQVFSAVGTATTLLPALYSAAESAIHNPLALVLPATVACSFGFALPTATPSNVVVLAKSQDLSRPLRVRDYCCSGLPLNILVVIVGAVISYFSGISVYDSQTPFPKWACDEGVTCLWVPIPGVHRDGTPFTDQACMLLASDNDSGYCILHNGTKINDEPYLADMSFMG